MRKVLALVTLFLLIFAGKSYAATSAIVYPNSLPAGAGNWVNSSNLLGAPNGTFATLTSASPTIELMYPSLSIPSTAHINALYLSIVANSSGNSGSNNRFDLLYSSTNCHTSGSPGDPGFPYYNFGTNGTSILTVTPSNCQNFSTLVTPSNLNSGAFVGWVRADSVSQTASWDTVGLQADYTNFATMSLSSVTASAGAQTVTFNISGDTTYTQAGEQCKVSLYEYNITDPTNPTIVSGGVAYILLNANAPRTSTLYQGQSTYLGYGFTSSVSTWSANGITMPFYNSKNTDIRAYTSCYHQTTNSDGSLSTPIYDVQQQALDPTSPIQYDPTLIATPSALTNVVGYAQPQCTSTDIICQIVQNVQAGLIELFAPNQTIDDTDFSNVNNAMLSRAPFAYGLAALNTNTTITPVASTSAIGLTFDFSNITGVPIPTKYQHMSYSDTGYIQTGVFAPLRPYEVIILWTIFFLYLIFILRSIFT